MSRRPDRAGAGGEVRTWKQVMVTGEVSVSFLREAGSSSVRLGVLLVGMRRVGAQAHSST